MKKNKINLFEVGPRDGLQNELSIIQLETKIWFIQSLLNAGIENCEIGAFVKADKVPQMEDTHLIYESISKNILKKKKSQSLWSLVPNPKGLQRAIDCNAKNIAFFTATSEKFNQKNIGMSVKDSLKNIKSMMNTAKKSKLQTRAYISTAFGCPFEGHQDEKKVIKLISQILSFGVDQVSIGDTIGVATPTGKGGVESIIKPLIKIHPKSKIAVHFHDTRGTALANAIKSYDLGIRTFDASAGGLGGCPFAPGASGNLASEDLIYTFEKMGIKTGINLKALCETSIKMHAKMNRKISSKYLQAYLFSCSKK